MTDCYLLAALLFCLMCLFFLWRLLAWLSIRKQISRLKARVAKLEGEVEWLYNQHYPS